MKRTNDVTNDMTNEIIQRERNNNKCYASTFKYFNLVITSKLK